MKEHMIGFHRWMLKHDTADNAEAYFHYTDEDMVEEYLREYFKDDTSTKKEFFDNIKLQQEFAPR